MTPVTPVGAVQVLQAAFFSTCHASAQDVLAGRERPFTAPAYSLLAGRARRFTSLVTQMHIEVCGSLAVDAADPPMAVFATCHGEIQTAEKLITDFHQSRMVSSARFALSVHNTPSGVYSVATGSTAAATTVTGANAIAAGWLEAALIVLAEQRMVLLSIADEPVPAVFRGPTQTAGVAAAFLLGPAPAGRRAALAIAPRGDARLAEVPAAEVSAAEISAAEVSAINVLARTVDAWTRDAPAAIALGLIQPGAVLELQVLPAEARA
jgi:hypothetical protein